MQLSSLLLGISLATVPSQSADTVATRADDAYHFAAFADGLHDESYAEWWYFNVVDPEQNIKLAFAYSILDPANLTGLGTASVMAVVYRPGQNFQQDASTSPDGFFASSEQANVLIAGSPDGGGRMEVIADNLYRIRGYVTGAHTVSWDLLYLRTGTPWFAFDRRRVGWFDWERMSWLPYMPSALVSGAVIIDGRRYDLQNDRGYHDHNWGEWIPIEVTWNWAQYAEPGFALALGDFMNFPTGVVSADVGSRRFVFDRSEYLLVHSDWLFEGVFGEWVPRTSWLYAANDHVRLVVRLSAEQTLGILPPLAWPFSIVPLLYEQTARISGAVWVSAPAGTWRLLRTFGGTGFKEYVTTTTR